MEQEHQSKANTPAPKKEQSFSEELLNLPYTRKTGAFIIHFRTTPVYPGESEATFWRRTFGYDASDCWKIIERIDKVKNGVCGANDNGFSSDARLHRIGTLYEIEKAAQILLNAGIKTKVVKSRTFYGNCEFNILTTCSSNVEKAKEILRPIALKEFDRLYII